MLVTRVFRAVVSEVAFDHHVLNVRANGERVAGEQDDVAVLARFERADTVAEAEDFGGRGRHSVESVSARHAVTDTHRSLEPKCAVRLIDRLQDEANTLFAEDSGDEGFDVVTRDRVALGVNQSRAEHDRHSSLCDLVNGFPASGAEHESRTLQETVLPSDLESRVDVHRVLAVQEDRHVALDDLEQRKKLLVDLDARHRLEAFDLPSRALHRLAFRVLAVEVTTLVERFAAGSIVAVLLVLDELLEFESQLAECFAQRLSLRRRRLAALRGSADLHARHRANQHFLNRHAARLHDHALRADDALRTVLHVDGRDSRAARVFEVEADRVDRVLDVKEGRDVEVLVRAIHAARSVCFHEARERGEVGSVDHFSIPRSRDVFADRFDATVFDDDGSIEDVRAVLRDDAAGLDDDLAAGLCGGDGRNEPEREGEDPGDAC